MIFMEEGVAKIAKQVESLDMPRTKLLMLIDPSNLQNLTLDDQQSAFKQAKDKGFNFNLSEMEVKQMFEQLTKEEKTSQRPKLSAQELANRIQKGVQCIILDQIREGLIRAHIGISDLF